MSQALLTKKASQCASIENVGTSSGQALLTKRVKQCASIENVGASSGQALLTKQASFTKKALLTKRARQCDIHLSKFQFKDARAVRHIAIVHLAMANIGLAYQVPYGLMFHRTRGRQVVSEARQAAQYLCHIQFGLNYTEIGYLFCRDRTSVAHACRKMEALRDEPLYDKALECLELGLRAFVESLELNSL